jgi:predicted ATPase
MRKNDVPFVKEPLDYRGMMTRLTRISIEGFRSIQSAQVDLKPLNVFIGANGSGKSNLISFLSLLNFALTRGFQNFVQTRGPASALLHFGPKVTHVMRVAVEFITEKGRNEYRCALTYAQGDTLIFATEEAEFEAPGHTGSRVVPLGGGGHRESGLSEPWSENDSTARVMKFLLGQCRVYQFHDTSLESYLRRIPSADDTGYLRDNGGNLAAFLFRLQREHPAEFRQIENTLNAVLPWFEGFVLKPQGLAPKQTIPLRWRMPDKPDYDFSAGQLSDGSLRFMCLVTLLLQPETLRPRLIVIDEPELGLHPAAESLVAGLIKAASFSSQILVSTQSATFLDHFSADDVIVAENNQGRSTFTRQSAESLKVWLDRYSLGQVWQKDIIGGRP